MKYMEAMQQAGEFGTIRRKTWELKRVHVVMRATANEHVMVTFATTNARMALSQTDIMANDWEVLATRVEVPSA